MPPIVPTTASPPGGAEPHARAPVTVLGSVHPLLNSLTRFEAPAGMSLAEIADRALAGRADAEALRPALIATVGDHAVPRAIWHLARPRVGTVVVFRVTVAGQLGRSLALFAVSIASLFLAPVLAPVLFPGFSAALGQAVVGAALTIGGTLAVNTLFPIRPTKLNRGAGGNLLSIAGARNEYRPWGVVPQILGRHRVAPPKAARDYTERVGNDIYVRSLFCAGYGPNDITGLKIGDTPVEDFDDVSTQIKAGYDTDEPISKFPSQVFEQTLSVTLLNADSWQSRTTAANCDEISGDITAPVGIYRYNPDNGKYNDRPVTVEARYRPASGGSWTNLPDIVFTRTKKPKRKGFRVEVPRDQYEVQVRKATHEYDGEHEVAETVIWTALRSITDNPPTAFQHKLSLVAMRIRASDQLNGAIDTFNLVAESRVKAFNGSAWVNNTASRNPADLFRHVLQGKANPRPRPDSAIDLDRLEAWWQYCEDNDFKCDLVVAEDGANVWDILADVAATGRATPAFVDGKWAPIFATADDPVVWHLTPRNSWGFSDERVYRRIPHALRCRFINHNRGWAEDERIVYDDGFSAANATEFESVEFPGVTRPNQVFRAARFQIAQARLRPSIYTLFTDIEGLRLTRGDRVRVSHDVPLWGTAHGRVKAVAGQTITLDERVILTEGDSYRIRFRLADGDSLLRTVVNTANETDTIALEGAGSVPAAGDLFSLGTAGQETVVLRVLEIRPGEDLTFQLRLVDDAPALLDIDGEEIPPYDPSIETPPDPFTLKPTGLVVSERVAGSGITAKPVTDVTVQVPRLGVIRTFEFQARDIDAGGDWESFATLSAPAVTASSDELEPGVWNFRVRSLFADGTSSGWVESGNQEIVGLDAPPPDVENLRIDVSGDTTLLSWSAVRAINLSHYQVRFSPKTDGSATWGASVPIVAEVSGQSAQVATQVGTILVKAVTFQGLESVNAAVLTSITEGVVGTNVIETLSEHDDSPPFGGAHSQTVEAGGLLLLDLQTSPGDGYFTSGTYTFRNALDLGDVYTCRLKAIIEAAGNDIGATMDTWDTLAGVLALDAADPSSWAVRVQYRSSNDPLTQSPSPDWSAWTDLVVGDATFRSIQFRALLTGTETVSPAISVLAAEVDMPDRVASGKNLASSAAGPVTVSFAPPFRALRGVTVTGKNMATGDYLAMTNDDESGFDVEFFDAGGSRVVRSFNYVAEGYGKVVT